MESRLCTESQDYDPCSISSHVPEDCIANNATQLQKSVDNLSRIETQLIVLATNGPASAEDETLLQTVSTVRDFFMSYLRIVLQRHDEVQFLWNLAELSDLRLMNEALSIHFDCCRGYADITILFEFDKIDSIEAYKAVPFLRVPKKDHLCYSVNRVSGEHGQSVKNQQQLCGRESRKITIKRE